MKLDDLAESVWQKGHPIMGWSALEWRRDDFGNAIRHDDYGNRDSEEGWEIDHIVPVSRNGSNHISNLRPLQWRANASRN